MKRNNWKIAFFICYLVLVIGSAFILYSDIDQGYTNSYMRQGYAGTEQDLQCLSKIISETDLSQSSIMSLLKKESCFENMSFEGDSIELNRVAIIFDQGKLVKVLKRW